MMAGCSRTPFLLLALAFGTAAAQVTCDAGWTPGGSKCYKTLTTGNLAHCRSACATAGGQLPCITSVAENAMVQHVANRRVAVAAARVAGASSARLRQPRRGKTASGSTRSVICLATSLLDCLVMLLVLVMVLVLVLALVLLLVLLLLLS